MSVAPPHTPVRAALLGSGLFATNSYLPSLPSVPGFKIAALWSRSERSVTALADKASSLSIDAPALFGDDGLEKIMADDSIQALIMVLPIGVQPELIRRAWKAGKHVISEKPVGRDVAEARELVLEWERKWKPKGIIWRVAENFAHEPFLHLAASLLREPAVGPVLFWRMHFETILPEGASYQATKWRTVPDYQGGFLLDGGVHWAALARTVLPARCRPYEVIANKSLHRAHMLPHDTLVGIVSAEPASTIPPRGQRTEVAGTISEADMPVKSGQSAPHGTFVLSWAIPDTEKKGRTPNELYVVCENATLRVVNLGREWRVILEGGAGSGIEKVEKGGKVTGVEVELQHFAAAITALAEGKVIEQENLAEPRDALWDVAFIQAALTSDGHKVVVDDVLKAERVDDVEEDPVDEGVLRSEEVDVGGEDTAGENAALNAGQNTTEEETTAEEGGETADEIAEDTNDVPTDQTPEPVATHGHRLVGQQ